MPKTAGVCSVVPVAFNASSGTPLYRQVYKAVRQGILDGQFPAGARLPATRSLAGELGVSRNTILLAFGQLLAEGYLEGKVGAGTYVSRVLPDQFFQASESPRTGPRSSHRRVFLSQRGRVLGTTLSPIVGEFNVPRPFQCRYPALDVFPHALWARLAGRHWRSRPVLFMGYGEPAGYRRLRQVIADYLREVRGVRCDAEQLVPKNATSMIC
jgi:GntR family transcriptional regulator/MocR family aminotransferase